VKNYLYLAPILLAACVHQSPKEKWAAERDETNKWLIPSEGIPIFIEDDYPRALAEAKAKHVPIFVDAWASWCHSCVSLKNFVFKDPRIAGETSHFVWLAIDAENPKNGDFRTRCCRRCG